MTPDDVHCAYDLTLPLEERREAATRAGLMRYARCEPVAERGHTAITRCGKAVGELDWPTHLAGRPAEVSCPFCRAHIGS